MKNTANILLIVGLSLFLTAVSVFAKTVCRVSLIEGKAYAVTDDAKKIKIELFMKFDQQECIQLDSDTSLELSFLKSRHTERWIGPATLRIEDDHAVDISQLKSAKVTIDSISATYIHSQEFGKIRARVERLAVAEDMELDDKGRTYLEAVNNEYTRQKQNIANDDMRADLFYIESLLDLGQRASACSHIIDLLIQNNNEMILREMLESIMKGEY